MIKYFFIIVLIIGVCFSMDDVSFPVRPTTNTVISLSDYLRNLDSITTKTNRIKDTVQNKYVRKLFLKDTTWDTLKSRWVKGDTAEGDTSYYRAGKTRVSRNDTVYSDSVYSRVGKILSITGDTLKAISQTSTRNKFLSKGLDIINNDTSTTAGTRSTGIVCYNESINPVMQLTTQKKSTSGSNDNVTLWLLTEGSMRLTCGYTDPFILYDDFGDTSIVIERSASGGFGDGVITYKKFKISKNGTYIDSAKIVNDSLIFWGGSKKFKITAY